MKYDKERRKMTLIYLLLIPFIPMCIVMIYFFATKNKKT